MADLEMMQGDEHEDLAGWVLGALNPKEAARFQAHLETCQECQDSAAELGPTAQLLKTAGSAAEAPADQKPTEAPADQKPTVNLKRPGDLTPTVNLRLPAPREPAAALEPPADLEERTLARVRQAAEKRAGRTGRWHRASYRWAAAAAAVVVVAGGATAITLAESAPAAAFTIPMQARDGSSATGKAVAHHTASGWSISMTVSHLKPLRAGQFYECWYSSPDSTRVQPILITAGTFTVDANGNGTMQMWSAADPRQFPTMEITEESPGDAAQHGQVILSGHAQA
jgi:anti-sigma factor RsiW